LFGKDIKKAADKADKYLGGMLDGIEEIKQERQEKRLRTDPQYRAEYERQQKAEDERLQEEAKTDIRVAFFLLVFLTGLVALIIYIASTLN